MAVKIRLKRLGKIRAPYYRVVVADSRTKRDGRVIEEIGQYHPTEHPSVIKIDSDRALYWLGVGAQPTEQVAALLKLTGDWGRFKGDKNAKSTVQVKDEKVAFTIEKKKPVVIRSKASVKDAEAAGTADAAADAERVDEAESSSTVEHETPAQAENS
ncbi:MAG: 30S ribosomal protein S16 [Acidobacteria bacterium]|nr:30S ribosomal protein S16 [Acidobacteriota bacterium]